MTLLCALQRSPEAEGAEEAARGSQEGKEAGTSATAANADAAAAAAVAEEAEAVRLFTSCSEEVGVMQYVHLVPRCFASMKVVDDIVASFCN